MIVLLDRCFYLYFSLKEWAPSHNLKSIKKKLAQVEASNLGSSVTSLVSPIGNAESTTVSQLGNILIKETFVFTDADGHIYHFNVEGSVIKDGNKIPPDSSIGSITSISWKGDQLVLADVDGNISIWDLKSNFYKYVNRKLNFSFRHYQSSLSVGRSTM